MHIDAFIIELFLNIKKVLAGVFRVRWGVSLVWGQGNRLANRFTWGTRGRKRLRMVPCHSSSFYLHIYSFKTKKYNHQVRKYQCTSDPCQKRLDTKNRYSRVT